MLQLIRTTDRANASFATANRNFSSHWARQRCLLLVRTQAVSNRCRRLYLGCLGGSGPVSPSQSVRSYRTVVSSSRRNIWLAVRVDATGGCRRRLLRDQFGHCRLRPLAEWLPSSAGVPRLSILGRFDRRSMDACHHGGCFVPTVTAPDSGQAATGASRSSHPREPPRPPRLLHARRADPGDHAQMASALDCRIVPLQSLRPPSAYAWAVALACCLSLSRSRRAFPAAGGIYASAVVL